MNEETKIGVVEDICDDYYGDDKFYSKFTNKGEITLKRKITKDIALMCPCCYNIMKAKIEREVSAEIKVEYNHLFELSDPFSITSEFCPFCNMDEVRFIILDENIAEAISMLNKKGYLTLFSCGGHVDEKGFHQGYIYFGSGIGNLLMKGALFKDIPFPKLWYFDKKDYKEGKIILRQQKGKIREKGLKNRIDNLMDWINKLPVL